MHEFTDGFDVLLRATLWLLGFINTPTAHGGDDVSDEKTTANEFPKLPLPIAEIRDLIKRAQAGDQSIVRGK